MTTNGSSPRSSLSMTCLPLSPPGKVEVVASEIPVLCDIWKYVKVCKEWCHLEKAQDCSMSFPQTWPYVALLSCYFCIKVFGINKYNFG